MMGFQPGHKPTEESKRKAVETRRRNNSYVLSKEHRKKISIANKGMKKPEGFNVGRIFSEETKRKISMANTGKIASEETRKKISVAHKGMPAWNKGIKTGVIPHNRGEENPENKFCAGCKKIKPINNFGLASNTFSKRKSRCLICRRKDSQKDEENNWGRNIKRRFGIGPKEYNQMLKKQKQKCAICEGVDNMRLAIDHDHSTGQIRGLLCGKCNIGIGMFKDNISNLNKAITYLKEQPIKMEIY